MLYWNFNMEINGISPRPPMSGQGRRTVYPGGRMPPRHSYFSMNISSGIVGDHTPFILQRMFIHAAETGQKEAERLIHCSCMHVDASTIQLVGYQTTREKRRPLPPTIHAQDVAQTPPMWAQMGTRGNKGYFVFLERLSKVEESWAARRKWRTRVCQHSSFQPSEQSLPEERTGHFGQMGVCWGQGGPLVGPDNCCHIGGMDRKAQQVNNQNEARHLLPFPRPRLAKKKVPRAELKAPQGLARGRQPSPVPYMQPIWFTLTGDLPGPKNIRRRPSSKAALCGLPKNPGDAPTSQSTRDRWGYPPELLIKNYELWLEWLAHQLDMPYWWEKLTAIPEVGDIKSWPGRSPHLSHPSGLMWGPQEPGLHCTPCNQVP